MPLPLQLIIIHHLLTQVPRQAVHRVRHQVHQVHQVLHPQVDQVVLVLLVVLLVLAGLRDQVAVDTTEEGTNPNSSPTLF